MEKGESRPMRGYDLRAHQELARAFPVLAARLMPLLFSEMRIECPNGHSLTVPAQQAASGREIFCPECRQAFTPVPKNGVAVPKAMRDADEVGFDTAVIPLPSGGQVRQGLALAGRGLVMVAGSALCFLLPRYTKVRRFISGSCGWALSAVVHAGLLLLVALLGAQLQSPPPTDAVLITADVRIEPNKDMFEKREKTRDIFRQEHQVPAPTEIRLPEIPMEMPGQERETEPEDLPREIARDLPQPEIPMMPAGIMNPVKGTPGTIGVKPTAPSGTYALRGDSAARLTAAGRGGGGPDTESAVDRALAWLARNQDDEGFWDVNGRKEGGTQPNLRPALTGIAVLAFLGAGYTHKGEHKYSQRVRRGVGWLIDSQRDGGWTDLTTGCCYSHALATLALCEACAMGDMDSGAPDDFDRQLRLAAQRATDWAVRAQNPYAGWDYRSRGGTSDTSVTVWNCMALKAARAAGLKVDNTAFQGIVNWLNAAQDTSGSGIGSGWTGGQFAYRGRPGARVMQRGTLMTVMHPAGLMMRLMTGTPPDRREAFGTANLLLGMIPREVSDDDRERIADLATEFISKNYLSWDRMTPEQQQRARADAEKVVAAQPRTADEYILRTYGARWSRLTDGQRAAVQETARQVIEKQPLSADDYIDRNYRQWEVFTDEQRAEARARAVNYARLQVLGTEFPRSIYFLYHSSLAMFQMGGRHWEKWNPMMKKTLLSLQVEGGDDDGAFSEDREGAGMMTCNGPVMATALGAMTLEVYYRYLRIHEPAPAGR